MSLLGPQLVIELDESGVVSLVPGITYLWRGKAFQVEPVGCVLCVEAEASSTLVRTDDDGQEHFVCIQRHGPLVEVKYQMVKQYTVTIGGVVRKGTERVEDSMLFPASMSTEEKDDLINNLLDEADQEEREAGAE